MAIQNPYADMMKAWSEYKAPSVPNFDMTKVMSYGRRNAEAVTAAGQCVAESAQALSRRQAELCRTQVEKVLKSAKDQLVTGSPEINTTKQVELAKTMFESSLNNLREIWELSTKSGLEVFDVLNKRAAEIIDEVTSVATPAASKKKAA